MSDQPDGSRKYATIFWEGDSKEVLQSFPVEVTKNFGFELWQIQQGLMPKDSRPLHSVGPGVFELRDGDAATWYRVVYLSRINDAIYVLHCFEKSGRKMPRREHENARRRLKAVMARLRWEKKHAK